MGEWELTGPYREGAFSIRGPNGEKIFLEIADEPRESARTKDFAEKLMEFCKRATAS